MFWCKAFPSLAQKNRGEKTSTNTILQLYGIVERLVGPHARKLEIFGRDHNTRPGWFSKFTKSIDPSIDVGIGEKKT